MAEEICRRLRFSNEDTAQIAALVANHMKFKDVQQMKPSTLKRFVAARSFRGAPGTPPLGLPFEPRNAGQLRVCEALPEETPAEQVRPATAYDRRRPESGRGSRPGLRSEQILEAVEEAQLKGSDSHPRRSHSSLSESLCPSRISASKLFSLCLRVAQDKSFRQKA